MLRRQVVWGVCSGGAIGGAAGVVDYDKAQASRLAVKEGATTAHVFWGSTRGPKILLVRGSWYACKVDCKHALRKVAYVSDAVVAKLGNIASSRLACYAPPVPQEGMPSPLTAEPHVIAFISILMATLEHGREDASQPASRARHFGAWSWRPWGRKWRTSR